MNNTENTKKEYKESHSGEVLGTIIFAIVLLGLMWVASKWLL